MTLPSKNRLTYNFWHKSRTNNFTHDRNWNFNVTCGLYMCTWETSCSMYTTTLDQFVFHDVHYYTSHTYLLYLRCVQSMFYLCKITYIILVGCTLIYGMQNLWYRTRFYLPQFTKKSRDIAIAAAILKTKATIIK